MRNLAFLELQLEKLTVSKPLRAKNPTIYIIMQDFYLAIVLEIKDKSLIVISRIMSHDITHYRSQSFISLTHVGRSGLHKKLSSAIKVYHGRDILCSNSATTNKLLLFISINYFSKFQIHSGPEFGRLQIIDKNLGIKLSSLTSFLPKTSSYRGLISI